MMAAISFRFRSAVLAAVNKGKVVRILVIFSAKAADPRRIAQNNSFAGIATQADRTVVEMQKQAAYTTDDKDIGKEDGNATVKYNCRKPRKHDIGENKYAD